MSQNKQLLNNSYFYILGKSPHTQDFPWENYASTCVYSTDGAGYQLVPSIFIKDFYLIKIDYEFVSVSQFSCLNDVNRDSSVVNHF